jgi:TetR/AcrR family transcriptional regulator, regulator of cefoperazone and chloramphenicol sensitivity
MTDHSRTCRAGKGKHHAMETERSETRIRILHAAAEIFAERGFAATTIRMICSRADVNLAAVNYHFGGKEALYRETIRYVRGRVYEIYPITFGLPDGAAPEERLYAFIHSFLLRTSADERNLGFGTLVMREMVEPTSALDMMIDEGIRSLFSQLVQIVSDLLGEDADKELVLASSRSIISQCLFYLFSRSVIGRMSPEQKFNPTDLDTIAAQILSFSRHALQSIAASRAATPAPTCREDL